MTPDLIPPPIARTRARRTGPRWILLIPYLALVFPQIYARNVPVLFGLPFFYWYQLACVLLTASLLGLVYHLTRD